MRENKKLEYLEQSAFYLPIYKISKPINELYNYFYLLSKRQIKISAL
jgi:hypothetical protein